MRVMQQLRQLHQSDGPTIWQRKLVPQPSKGEPQNDK